MATHIQSKESYDSIPDQLLRELVRRAITRGGELDRSLFIALYYGGSGGVDCFDAALPMSQSEFLRGCAHYAFPRGTATGDAPPTRREYSEVLDRELRGALENAVDRATALNFSIFVDLWIGQPGRPLSLHFCCAAYLPREIAMHLHRCFEMAVVASTTGNEPGSYGGRSSEPLAN